MASNPNSVQRPSASQPATLSTPPGVQTPNRRAKSADPTPNALSASGRRPNAATPHGRAAIRALDQRRAQLFTPGRARRRSVRDQRETPRDILRNLSRVLAPSTRPVASSSSSSSTSPVSSEKKSRRENTTLASVLEDAEEDDEFPIERPRFSLPLREDDDDEHSVLKPPRSSGLEDLDDNFTLQSIEMPRRALSEGPSRLSMGSVRVSDYYYNRDEEESVGIDSGFFPPLMEDVEDSAEVRMDVEDLDDEQTRRQTLGLGRESEFGAIRVPDGGDESTFVMAPQAQSSPVRDQPAFDDIVDYGGSDLGPEGDLAGEEFDVGDETDGALDEPTALPVVSQEEVNIKKKKAKKPGRKISQYGIEYPSLPQGVVKRLATTFAKTSGMGHSKINPDTLQAIIQASDWFFEQLGDDLQAYSKHAGRKTIDESDVITLMRRQRQTNGSTTPFALAQRHLPRELLQELRMPAPPPTKAPRKKASRLSNVDNGDDNG